MYGPVTHVIFDLDGLILAVRMILSQDQYDTASLAGTFLQSPEPVNDSKIFADFGDTETIFEQCYQIVANEYGKCYTWEVQAKIMGETAEMGAKKIINELELPITLEVFMDKIKNLCSRILPDAKMKPGAERLIRHLHHHNIPLAVATSSSDRSCKLKTQHHLELFGLFHHITSAVEDSSVKQAKPFPDVFLVCASYFDERPSPEKVLVIEDSPAGVEAGLAANMPVLMVPDSRLDPLLTTRATLVLKSLEEFLPETFGLPSYN